MITTKADIPSSYSRLMAHEVGLSKAELPRLLVGTELGVEQLLNEDTLITPAQQLRVLSNALKLSGDNGFGLRLGQRLIPSAHGAVGFMAFSSRDLYTALQAVQAYVPTRMSFANVSLQEVGSQLFVKAAFNAPMDESSHRALVETFAVVFFKLAEFIVGRKVSEAVTHLDYDAPSYSGLYKEVLPGAVTFSAGHFGIAIPLSLAREPNASANHENYLLALKQCERQRAQLQTDKASYQYQVERMLLEHPGGQLNEDDAAAMLFMSKRSLARRLTGEGTGFREIRERLLSEQAAGYLLDSELSVEAIATVLGYYDSANFRRAFKRWFKVSPAAYRLAQEKPVAA